MNYELAKKLYDAKFPQEIKDNPIWENIYYRNGVLVIGAFIENELEDGMVKVPTLSELIEACGEDFRMLLLHTQHNKKLTKPWEAVPNKKRVPNIKSQKGESETEAVALLWLALNK